MSELSINTTQNVKINFVAASAGERIGAYLIDGAIKLSYIFVISMVFFYWLNFDKMMSGLDSWSRIAIFIIIYFPAIIYSITLESIFEGQSLGKKLLKIKVVKIDGYQAGFGDYLIRWLFRIVELSIGNGIIALIAMIVNKQNQRLGDMAAGTAVISLKNNININHTILQEVNEDYVPTYPLVIKLSDNDVRIIKENFEKAVAARDYATLIKLRDKIIQVTGIKNQSGNDQDFIKTLLKDYNYYTQNM